MLKRMSESQLGGRHATIYRPVCVHDPASYRLSAYYTKNTCLYSHCHDCVCFTELF